jgi:TonB family protein
VPNGSTSTGAPAPSTPGPPASTPKPACKTPYQDATATQTAQPEYPEQAREAGIGTVEVNVTVVISASGSPISASIPSSSGNMYIDNAAKQAAMQSQYQPKIVDCQPVQGAYNFKVTFDPNQ